MSYKTFNSFVEDRGNQEFSQDFHKLCESIVVSGIDFDEYWMDFAMPVLFSQKYDSETELLSEFLGFGNSMRNIGASLPGRQAQQPSDAAQPLPQSHLQSFQKPVDPAIAQKEAQRQKKLAGYQQNVDQSIDKIKKRFAQAMQEFMSAVKRDAMTSNDWVAFKIGQAFHNKIMQTAQPVIDNFKMKAAYGQRDTSDFDAARGGMLMNKAKQWKQQQAQRQLQQPATPLAGNGAAATA